MSPGPRRAPRGAGSNYKESAGHTSDPPPDSQPGKAKPADREALGRSRGGLSTKVHLVADQRCRPLAFVTTVGQRHDAVAFELALSKVAVRRPGPGRPRTRPDYVLADKAYSSKAIREHLTRRGIAAVIPTKADQEAACAPARDVIRRELLRKHEHRVRVRKHLRDVSSSSKADLEH